MQNPFADLIPEQQAGPVVIGTPRPKTPAPVRPVVEARDEVGLQIDRSRLAAAPADARKAEADARKAELELQRLERLAADPTGALGVEQGKATGFYSRAAKANQAYEQTGVGAEPLALSVGRAVLPESLEGYIISPERQSAEANVRSFIGAILRYESGAAIPPEEFQTAYRTYFPQTGEDEATAKTKARLRAEALEALAIGSGPGAKQVRLAPDIAALPFEERNKLFQQKIRSGAPFEEVARYGEELRLSFDPEELRRAVGRKNARVEGEPQPKTPGLISRLGDAAINTAAGIGQGIAAIPDAATNALAGLMAGGAYAVGAGANALGLEDVARGANWTGDQWRKPITIGGLIERAAPTPDDAVGQGVRFASQFTGGAVGAPQSALTGIAERLVGRAPAAAPALPPVRASRRQVMSDADALGIKAMPVVTGGPTTRLATAAAAQTPGGAYPIARGVERMTEGGSRALRTIAEREGQVANVEAAGQIAARGGLSYRSASRTKIGRLYDRAAAVAGDVRVIPAKAVQAIDENLANLNEIPGGTEGAKYLQALKEELATKFPDGVTVQGLRGMRTQLRDRFYKEGLRGSDIERRVNEIVQSASDDIADSLTAAGKSEAADIYRQADAAWAERIAVLDDFLMPIIGKKGEKSGEQVFRALQAAAKGNGERLRGFIGALPEQEAGTVRATLIHALGKPSSAAQNAEGAGFTFDGFLTRWNEMDRTARNALFTGEGREAIDKLARVSSEVKRAGKYANRSNTGSVGMAGLTVASGYAGFLPLMATLGTQYGAGRLLASPAVARVLARIGSSKTPAESKAAARSLSIVAARNPALADDITALQARLEEAFSASPATTAAAQENK